ncbi:MAG: hypothetical protein WBE48_13055, partial [Xanthobacteraceae bacterium]
MAAEAIQRGTAIVQHVGMVRLDRERPVEAAHRFRVIALRVERQAEIGPGIGRIGIALHRGADQLERFGQAPALIFDEAEHVQSVELVRPLAQH